VQLAFFLLGLCYGSVTFKLAGQIHLEAFYSMPRGKCRRLVKWMALVGSLQAYIAAAAKLPLVLASIVVTAASLL
jgi:hypothetical protein